MCNNEKWYRKKVFHTYWNWFHTSYKSLCWQWQLQHFLYGEPSCMHFSGCEGSVGHFYELGNCSSSETSWKFPRLHVWHHCLAEMSTLVSFCSKSSTGGSEWLPLPPDNIAPGILGTHTEGMKLYLILWPVPVNF